MMSQRAQCVRQVSHHTNSQVLTPPSDLVLAQDDESVTHLVRWQCGEGLDDGGQGHLRLLGHVGGARHVVGGAADKPRTGIS